MRECQEWGTLLPSPRRSPGQLQPLTGLTAKVRRGASEGQQRPELSGPAAAQAAPQQALASWASVSPPAWDGAFKLPSLSLLTQRAHSRRGPSRGEKR